IPYAQVEIGNIDTGVTQTTKTTGDGFYSLTGLMPGRYSMTVRKQQFKTVSVVGITLNVQDNLSRDIVLPVGPATESVTVDGNALVLDTTDAAVSTVIDSTFVENMPLNGRSFQTLIMLTPGVVLTQTSASDQGQFSVDGERADGNYFTIDGVSANIGIGGYRPLSQFAAGALPALSAQGGTNSLVSVDAMQEFRIQTSSFAPEFGRTPGGQIAISTRSGSNAFHGTLFDYVRNDVLDANNWFSDYDSLAKPQERQNDFGGVFGGPILRDKTFFFFSYEGLRLDQPETAETIVPDDASRQAATAAEAPFLDSFPDAGPNATEVPGDDFAQYNASYSNPSTLDAYSLRVDHAINTKLNLFGRYDYSPSKVTQRDFTNEGTPGALSNTETDSFSMQTFTLGFGAGITPAIANEARANLSNVRVGTVYNLDNFGGAVPPSSSVLFPTGSGIDPANASSGWYLYGGGELLVGSNNVEEQRQINLVDNLSATRGAHQLKFGVDYRWLAPFVRPVGYSNFLLFFGVSDANGPGSVLSGSVFQIEDGNQFPVALLSQNFSAYGQDTWKVTPRLTLTYGLRWDVNPALKGKNASSEPFTVMGLDDPATMTIAPRGTPLYNTTYGNVAPRAGAAYRLRQRQDWETVLRAGAGVFYDLGSGPLGAVSAYWPFQTTTSSLFAPLPLTPAEVAAPPFSLSLPVTDLFVAEPNLMLPRTYQWNLAIEQSLGASQTVSATYLGAVGRDLLREDTLAFPNADINYLFAIRNTATSDYNALQLKFQRRLSRGLQALASYTFSHSIDIASSDTFIYSATPDSFANPNVDRGDSDYDVRHSFTGAVTYDVPAPKSPTAERFILGGWSTDGFVMARTAPPVNLFSANEFRADGVLIQPRPNVNSGQPYYLFGSQYPGGKAFNPAAFTTPPAGHQGDLGRNALRGFGAWQADFAVHRQFHLTKKAGLQFRAEMFNVFNHPNFAPPNNLVGYALFGQSTQTLGSSLGAGGGNGGFNPLYQIGGPRSVQLALKLKF
ncbi:MAG: TonB-dependent receptor, partial [Terracidiphilus sp.]